MAGSALGCDAEVDRTEASIAPARGGDRTPDTCARSPRGEMPRRVGGALLPAAIAALSSVTLLAGVFPGPFSAAGAAAAPARRADHITLVRQSPWVGPDALHQDLTMGLRVQSGSPSSALKLSFAVYNPLSSRSAFDETLSGHGLGTVDAQSPPMALSSFATNAQGVTEVTIPVDGDTTPTGTGNWTADLGCQPGSCANVYPVKVTLTDSAAPAPGSDGAQLVTYLVYDDPSSSSQLLRFALVVPLGLPPAPTNGHGGVTAPSASSVAGLEGLLGAIEGSPAVPITLAPDPGTLEGLERAGRSHTVSEVAALSSSSSRQTLSGSFVPVDAGALVGSGLSGELGAQLARGAQVLASPSIGVHAARGTWVARTALTPGAVDQLAPDYPHLVVAPSSVSGPMGPLTVTQPFTLSPTASSPTAASPTASSTTGSATPVPSSGAAPTAMVSDVGLGALLVPGKAANAPLAAVRLVAELSLIYYEVPNLLGPGGTPAPRGVVAVAPLAWAPKAAFVSSLLTDLEGNPVIRPVTVDQLFDQVPVGADNEPVARHLVTPTPSGPVSSTAANPAAAARARQAAFAAALRNARGRQAGFASSVAGSSTGTTLARSTDDLLLGAESSLLTPRQQQTALAGFESALGKNLHELKVRTDTIRLTAGTASVPITLLRNTTYPVTVVVRLTSDKLRFPAAHTQVPGALCKAPKVQSSAGRSTFSALCTLNHSTNAVYVNMQSRTSGDFEIDVTLKSPEGNLILAGGQLTVRSLSTSAVAIALSAGAALVLVVWWGRTLWRGGKRRRGVHVVTRTREAAT